MVDAVLAVLIFSPLILTFLLKSNAAVSFLTLCGAFVLITFASADIKDLTGKISLEVSSSTVNVIILILPLLLTLLLTRKAVSGGIKLILHLAAAFCTGVLLALVSIPLLNQSLRTNFSNSWGWTNLQKIQTPIIVVGVLLSFLLVWAGGFKHVKKHKK